MLNWLSRYGFVIEGRLRRRRRGGGTGPPILDVGSGPYGIGFWTGEPFVGVDLSFETPPHPTNFALRADAAALPFADGAFAEVVLADLLEHVPPERRPTVLSEALRVATRRVYITFPTGEAARQADRIFADYHRRVFGTTPDWFNEHEAWPLPRPEELAAFLTPLAQEGKLTFRIFPGENAIFHLMLTLVDHLPGNGVASGGGLVRAVKGEVSDWLRIFRRAAVGSPYRVNCVIELAGRPGPLLEKLSVEPDLFRVLACPVCRRGLIPEPEALRCLWCGTAYLREAAPRGGVWNLLPQSPTRRPDAGVLELQEHLGLEFDPSVFVNVAEKVEAEFEKFADPVDFYRNSQTYLYDLTSWDLSGAKAPGLRLIRALTFPDDPVLDYGCGVGADGIRLIEHGYERVSFADFDNPSTRYLRWRLGRRGLAGAPAGRVYDIEKDPPPEKVHHLVYAFDVIEHVPDARSFLRTLERLADIVVVGFLLDPPDKKTDVVYPEYYRLARRLIRRIRRSRCVLFDGTHRVEVRPGQWLRYRFMAWYSKPRPYLSVIIATYNRPEDLKRCLESLKAQTGCLRPKFEVVVVDDGSDPAQAAENEQVVSLFRKALRLRFIRQAHRGLAVARNRAIRAARGYVLLFLNDDVTLPPDGLEAHIKFHREHPELWVGMLGRVEWAPGLEVTPIMDYVMGAGGHQFDFKGLTPGKEVDFWHFYGTCLSVKRRFILKTGEFFDPDFTYAWDDIEWGYRLAAKGLKVYYRPEAVVYHHHRVDTDYYVRRQRLAGRMAVVFARKHPELAPRLLPSGVSDAAEIEALRTQVGLLEPAVRENPELNAVLENLYGRLLEAAYRLGATEGGELPLPASELVRRAEVELAAGRPLRAVRLLRPLRYGPSEVRVLYRLAAVLAGSFREIEADLAGGGGIRALWRQIAAALEAANVPAGLAGAPGPAADEYAGVLFWLLKLDLLEDLDKVFPLAGWVWPDDERARVLARVAARAGRWEAVAALLSPLRAAGKASPEDLSLLARAALECGLAEADGILKGAVGEHA